MQAWWRGTGGLWWWSVVVGGGLTCLARAAGDKTTATCGAWESPWSNCCWVVFPIVGMRGQGAQGSGWTILWNSSTGLPCLFCLSLLSLPPSLSLSLSLSLSPSLSRAGAFSPFCNALTSTCGCGCTCMCMRACAGVMWNLRHGTSRVVDEDAPQLPADRFTAEACAFVGQVCMCTIVCMCTVVCMCAVVCMCTICL